MSSIDGLLDSLEEAVKASALLATMKGCTSAADMIAQLYSAYLELYRVALVWKKRAMELGYSEEE